MEIPKTLRRRRTGGYLTRPVKKNPNKIDGLYDRTLDMQPGDVSDIPIKYAGNWYILRRGDSSAENFCRGQAGIVGFVAQSQGLRRRRQSRRSAPRIF